MLITSLIISLILNIILTIKYQNTKTVFKQYEDFWRTSYFNQKNLNENN
jgi:hypothetical protein